MVAKISIRMKINAYTVTISRKNNTQKYTCILVTTILSFNSIKISWKKILPKC